jgi:hypothetical protein
MQCDCITFAFYCLLLFISFLSLFFLLFSQMCWSVCDSSPVLKQSCCSGNTKTTQVSEREEREDGRVGRECECEGMARVQCPMCVLLSVFLMHAPHCCSDVCRWSECSAVCARSAISIDNAPVSISINISVRLVTSLSRAIWNTMQFVEVALIHNYDHWFHRHHPQLQCRAP